MLGAVRSPKGDQVLAANSLLYAGQSGGGKPNRPGCLRQDQSLSRPVYWYLLVFNVFILIVP